MPRFMIDLDPGTYEALCTFAREERRQPAGQAEWMLRQAIEWRLKHQLPQRPSPGVQVAPADTEGEV